MELTPGQQRLVFGVLALALVGLGIFLIEARGHGASPSAAPSAPAGSAPASAGGLPTALPSATPVTAPGGGADIYQWLPFTAADLTAMANTTTAFAKAYSTWSYTESDTGYAAGFKGLAAPSEITSLTAGYDTPGVAQQRTADKQVSAGAGTIEAISSVITQPGESLIFTVTISQRLASTQPTLTQSTKYSVTLAPSGGSWLVSDIEPFGAGNQ